MVSYAFCHFLGHTLLEEFIEKLGGYGLLALFSAEALLTQI